MSRVIEADPGRLWKALTRPDEIVSWDARVLGAVDASDDYPFTGGNVRWRYMLGNVQVVMHDRPLEVVPGARLKRKIRLGSLRYDQTFNLVPVEDRPFQTNLAIKLVTPNWIPLVGDSVDRFSARELATTHVDETLRQVQVFFSPGAGDSSGADSSPDNSPDSSPDTGGSPSATSSPSATDA